MGIWEILCAICCKKTNTNIKTEYETEYENNDMQSQVMLKIHIGPIQETKNSPTKQIYQPLQVTIVTNKHDCIYLSNINDEHKHNEINQNPAIVSKATELTRSLQLPVTRNLQCNSSSCNSTISTSYIPCQGEININRTYPLTSTEINSKHTKASKLIKTYCSYISSMFA